MKKIRTVLTFPSTTKVYNRIFQQDIFRKLTVKGNETLQGGNHHHHHHLAKMYSFGTQATLLRCQQLSIFQQETQNMKDWQKIGCIHHLLLLTAVSQDHPVPKPAHPCLVPPFLPARAASGDRQISAHVLLAPPQSVHRSGRLHTNAGVPLSAPVSAL